MTREDLRFLVSKVIVCLTLAITLEECRHIGYQGGANQTFAIWVMLLILSIPYEALLNLLPLKANDHRAA
jgi:hypothetical protein